MTAENSLTHALRFAATSGWCPIPLMPLSKSAALSGYYQSATSAPELLADQWRRAAFRIAHDDEHPERAAMEPGIGVVLGVSGLAVLDADTPEQVDALRAAFIEHGLEPPVPTVRTPGSADADGTLRHHGGGHVYCRLPADVAAHIEVLATTKIVLKIGDSEGPQADLMTGRCYVVVPPTRRPEGEYVPTGAKIRVLPEFLADRLRAEIESIEARRARAEQRAADGVRDEKLWAWFEATPPERYLPEGYVAAGTDPSGCTRWLRPGASSTRSATSHVAGCSCFPGADPTTPPPITFFTSEVPEYVADALAAAGGNRSASALRLYAHKCFGGDMRQARLLLGLSAAPRRSRKPVAARCGVTREWVPITLPKQPEPELALARVRPRPMAPRRASLVSHPAQDAATQSPPPPDAPDDFTPAVLPDLPAGFAAPAPFIPRNLVAEVVAAVAAHAAEVGPDQAAWLYAVEGEQGSYMGRDGEPAAWSNRHREMRERRDHLMSIRQATTDRLAELVPDVPAGRIRSLMRLLLPLFAKLGMVVRERPPYDPFVFRGKGKDGTGGDSTTAGDSGFDESEAEQEKFSADAFSPGETGWLIYDTRESEEVLPTFPPLIGHSAVDPDSLPHDVPVLTRRMPDDPLIFVPPAGTDPEPAISAVMASVPDGGICAVDVETTGPEWSDTLRTIQLGSATVAVVLDAADPAHTAAVGRAIEGHILSGRIWATAHNSAFDALHLHRAGITDGLALLDHCFDTYILQTLIEAPLSDDEKKGGASDKRGLKALTSDWLDIQWSSRAEDAMREYWASRKWRGQQGWARTDVTEPHYLFYAGSDVIDAARLCAVLLGIVRVGMGDEVIRREHLMAADAGRMQLNGYLLDLEALARDEGARQEEVTRLRQALVDLGLDNPNSTPQIKTALIAERDAEIDRRVAEAVARAEAEGSDVAAAALLAAADAEKAVPPVLTTDKASLQTMRWSRIAPAVLAYRKVTKTAGTYTSAWPKKADENGRLHPNINSLKASTGRFSASGPNLQNVPKEVRKYLIAGPGKALVTADFSSIEMRVGAAYAGEENLRDDYLAGLDPYREVAKLAYDTDDPTDDERNATKPILLGRMYGRGAENLARVAKSRNPDADFDDLVQQAERIMREGIDKRYPRLRQASYELGGLIRAGHTRIEFPDASGRTISLDPSNAHKAFNARVQGAARELLVDAAFRIKQAGLSKHLWLPVHDEWVVLVDEERAEEVRDILIRDMATTFRGIPILVEAKVLGQHWGKG